MATTKPRFSITVDEKLLEEIDDYRFENRHANRTESVIELIRLGLETLKNQSNSNKKEDN